MAATYTNIGNYVKISSILEILKEKGVAPEDAYLEMDAFEDHNSYGDKFISKELNLVVELPNKG